jgi:hypothetical protein
MMRSEVVGILGLSYDPRHRSGCAAGIALLV